MEAKRRRVTLASQYEYPPIPEADQDVGGTYRSRNPWHRRLVPVTTRTDWGFGDAAAFRAGLVEEITPENEQLIRTHHRAFANVPLVYVVESEFGPPLWLVCSPVSEIEAGGRPIHL
ncbi:hypothetical protein VTN77DRAFT_6557 [Rasamsonia byssochlamydoides]|uniref:uncharacterized protein n=1 Tax=Rasamsonia byssochlamydoides TaxID=89139 RepID=UPI003743417E